MWLSRARKQPHTGCAGALAGCRRRRPEKRAGRQAGSSFRGQLHVNLLALALLAGTAAAAQEAPPTDLESGLIKDEAGVWRTTRDHCTECHSATLLQQNPTDRDGWIRTIRRMEKDEGLEPLGDLEKPILDYLAAHYGVQVKPTELRRRRAPLRQAPIEKGAGR